MSLPGFFFADSMQGCNHGGSGCQSIINNDDGASVWVGGWLERCVAFSSLADCFELDGLDLLNLILTDM